MRWPLTSPFVGETLQERFEAGQAGVVEGEPSPSDHDHPRACVGSPGMASRVAAVSICPNDVCSDPISFFRDDDRGRLRIGLSAILFALAGGERQEAEDEDGGGPHCSSSDGVYPTKFSRRCGRHRLPRNRTFASPRLLTNRRNLQRATESWRAVAPRVRDEPPGLASGDPRATERTESELRARRGGRGRASRSLFADEAGGETKTPASVNRRHRRVLSEAGASSSPGRTRTYNQVINSHLLYH